MVEVVLTEQSVYSFHNDSETLRFDQKPCETVRSDHCNGINVMVYS